MSHYGVHSVWVSPLHSSQCVPFSDIFWSLAEACQCQKQSHYISSSRVGFGEHLIFPTNLWTWVRSSLDRLLSFGRMAGCLDITGVVILLSLPPSLKMSSAGTRAGGLEFANGTRWALTSHIHWLATWPQKTWYSTWTLNNLYFVFFWCINIKEMSNYTLCFWCTWSRVSVRCSLLH